MRFEVKGGGIAAILFAVTILSGAVFVLGLLAGYDVGRQAQLDAAQLATSYPLQQPPVSGAKAAEPAASPPVANPPVESAGSATAAPALANNRAAPTDNRTLAAEGARPKRRPSQPAAAPARQRLASATIPPAAPPRSVATPPPSAYDSTGAVPESETPGEPENEGVPQTANTPNSEFGRRVASTAPPSRRKPYNIQIQAAMDISGADAMMARLQKLGYPSHLVPTEIAGQRWYKVEVGPYATAEDAANAEAELRQKYDATYGGVAHGNSGRQAAAGDNSEE